jgi:hypothetical protein
MVQRARSLFVALTVLLFGAGASASDAGTDAGVSLPAWRVGLPLLQWTEIPGTSGAGGDAIDPWGALAENKATAELYIAASGGHNDSSDNRVVSISLMSDAPTWLHGRRPAIASCLPPTPGAPPAPAPASRVFLRRAPPRATSSSACSSVTARATT